MPPYDVIVLGLGAMGSAAAYHLARRGARVLGIDQFGIAHDRGSSHGETRIIRKAYFEHPDYVPLLHRAYELWEELESDLGGAQLFKRVGLLLVGLPEGEVLRGVRLAAAQHSLAIDELPIREVAERFPGFRAAAPCEALFERDAGYLEVTRCVAGHAGAALNRGAELRTSEPVREWASDRAGAAVRTDAGWFHAARLIIAGGAWSARLLPTLGLPLTVLRKVQLWFATDDERYRPDHCPVFCFETADGFFYGFPTVRPGRLKVAEHSGRQVVPDPDALDRRRRRADTARVRAFVREYLPGVTDKIVADSTCMYTMTPDSHFIIDRHPQHENVVFAAGFSGHGFKFAPIVGKVLADLALAGRTEEPIGFLSASRPGLRG